MTDHCDLSVTTNTAEEENFLSITSGCRGVHSDVVLPLTPPDEVSSIYVSIGTETDELPHVDTQRGKDQRDTSTTASQCDIVTFSPALCSELLPQLTPDQINREFLYFQLTNKKYGNSVKIQKT